MKQQSKKMSLVESLTNVAVGYAVNVTAQVIVFPWFGWEIPLVSNLMIGGIFTIISIVRSFTLRRIFEVYRVNQSPCESD